MGLENIEIYGNFKTIIININLLTIIIYKNGQVYTKY